MGQINSMEASTTTKVGMFSAAKKAALTGYEILKALTAGPYPDESTHQEPDATVGLLNASLDTVVRLLLIPILIFGNVGMICTSPCNLL